MWRTWIFPYRNDSGSKFISTSMLKTQLKKLNVQWYIINDISSDIANINLYMQKIICDPFALGKLYIQGIYIGCIVMYQGYVVPQKTVLNTY